MKLVDSRVACAVVLLALVACSTSGAVRGLEDRRLGSEPPSDPLDHDAILAETAKPTYPIALYNRYVEGFVFVRYEISETGIVENPVVLYSQPEGSFDSSALQAARQWRYQPKVVDGVPVRSRRQSLITFCIQGGPRPPGTHRSKPCVGEQEHQAVMEVLRRNFAD